MFVNVVLTPVDVPVNPSVTPSAVKTTAALFVAISNSSVPAWPSIEPVSVIPAEMLKSSASPPPCKLKLLAAVTLNASVLVPP